MEHCIVYLPSSYVGGGPSYTAVSISTAMKKLGADIVVCLDQSWVDLPADLPVLTGVPSWVPRRVASRLPGPVVQRLGELAVKRAIKNAPAGSVLWTWLDPSLAILDYALSHNLTIVRETINTPRQYAYDLWIDAFHRYGLEAVFNISKASFEAELKAFERSNFVIAPSQAVEDALVACGVPAHKIVPSSFGWDPDRIKAPPARNSRIRPTALFLGRVSVRKGIPLLLRAWQEAELDATLLIAGQIEDGLEGLLNESLVPGQIEYRGYVDDVPALLQECDFLVFPTIEEGAPLVVYEACGAALPVLTTSMGAARIIENGKNGFILPAYDLEGWKEALCFVVDNPGWLQTASCEARQSSERFSWLEAGKRRLEFADRL